MSAWGLGIFVKVNLFTLATPLPSPIITPLGVPLHTDWHSHTHTPHTLIQSYRTGFAKVAGLTGVPLIPVYTANIRLAYRTVCLGSLLEVTRLPLVGIYRKYNI